MLESLTWERVGEEEDPEGSHSQNVRGELGWGVRRLFVLYFLGRGGERGWGANACVCPVLGMGLGQNGLTAGAVGGFCWSVCLSFGVKKKNKRRVYLGAEYTPEFFDLSFV